MQLLVSYHNELWKQSRIQLKQFLLTKEQLSLLRFCDAAEQLNSIFYLLQHADRNFNAARYLNDLNKMHKYAQDLRDDYLMQLLAHKHEVDVWQAVADAQSSGGHYERLKMYFRTNVSGYSLSKQTGKRLLVKITPEQLVLFVDFLFQKIKKQTPEFLMAVSVGQLRKDIIDYIFMAQRLLDVQQSNNHNVYLVGLKKIVELMDAKYETEKMLLIMRRININSKLQKEIHKQQLIESQMNTEISLALKAWIKKNNHESIQS